MLHYSLIMSQTFFFYDLETTGVNPRSGRIMQFAGQRTDENLKPIGEPYNILIKLTEDILPEPDAILITGITPQKTIADGITEAEFVELFVNEIATPNTIFVGFNSIRFDDEFMRFTFYRNFIDAYEWQWKNGCSRWDILDLSRMTRALRPEGIKWPFDSSGKPTNRLEFLSSVNKLDHTDAHDALSDVRATIALAELIKTKQPKLFDYLLSMRDKHKVEQLAKSGEPFVYSSGKYSGEFEKTTIVYSLTENKEKNGMLVYDLRHDPEQFVGLNHAELAEIWKYNPDPEALRLPVKTLKYNRSPAIAPLGVLDPESEKRLQIDQKLIQKHRKILDARPEFAAELMMALEILNKEREQTSLLIDESAVDSQLYDGFIGDADKRQSKKVHKTSPDELSELASGFNDERLKNLLPLYKARNFSSQLSDEERQEWEAYRKQKLLGNGASSAFARFGQRLGELGQNPSLNDEKRFLLEELQLYGESIMPDVD